MEVLKNKLNNKGSTLLMVIVCLAFIGILGSLLLSVSATNLQMKLVESKSKDNFYSCEIAMEEIRVRIQELTSESIKDVYENEVLPKYAIYAAMDEDTQNTDIQQLVLDKLKDKLAKSGDMTKVELTKFTKFLSDPPSGGNRFFEEEEVPLVIESNTITVKDIKIIYQYNEYETSIASDIRITIPAFTFSSIEDPTEQYHIKQPFENYVLIADNGIYSNNPSGKTSIQPTNIIGSVYAGVGGIAITNSIGGQNILNMDGKEDSLVKDNIVTRGDITIFDGSKLAIGTSNPPIIWADNLVTETTDSYLNSSARTRMDIKGICIIKDDLVLNGRNSDVKLESGAYIGYTGTHTAEGSAIMINGSGSSLDLSGLSALLLAGRGHISIEDSVLTEDTDILTGESIAFKSNQRAYLIPGKYIPGILHNPITQADVNSGVPEIKLEAPTNGTDIDYNAYVADDPLKPYKIAAKQTGEGGAASTLRYYYLNFASGKKADAFLAKFVENQERADEISPMGQFTLDSVELPNSSTCVTETVGNIMSYNGSVQRTEGMSFNPLYADDVALDGAIKSLRLDEVVYTDTGLLDKKVSMLEGLYSKITHLLSIQDTKKVYQEGDNVVETYVKAGGVSHVVDGDYSIKNTDKFVYTEASIETPNVYSITSDTELMKQSFVVVDGDVSIGEGVTFKGFLIASGDINIGEGANIQGLVVSFRKDEDGEKGNITVNDNVHVKGRIVAGDNITLGKGCDIKTDAETETFIADIFTSEGTIMNQLFKGTDKTISFSTITPASVFVDLSNMISYENWRKDK